MFRQKVFAATIGLLLLGGGILAGCTESDNAPPSPSDTAAPTPTLQPTPAGSPTESPIPSPVYITEEQSRKIAEEFVRKEATFAFDGMEETLVLTETLVLRCPACWEFVFEFDSGHAGYGDRTDQMLAQVITHHRAVVTVVGGDVTRAIMDERWDMIAQQLVPMEAEKHYCTEEDRKAEACIEVYRPVCGWFDPEQIQCFAYPCAATYSNECEACRDPRVLYWTEGECPLVGYQKAVDESFNGQTITIPAGALVIITLESNATTGFSWAVSANTDEAVLQPMGSEYRAPGLTDPPVLGAGGHEEWTFKTLAKGQSTLSMAYERSWEKGVPPAQTFTLTVIVE